MTEPARAWEPSEEPPVTKTSPEASRVEVWPKRGAARLALAVKLEPLKSSVEASGVEPSMPPTRRMLPPESRVAVCRERAAVRVGAEV